MARAPSRMHKHTTPMVCLAQGVAEEEGEACSYSPFPTFSLSQRHTMSQTHEY